jgi:arylesterase / paraoxonase
MGLAISVVVLVMVLYAAWVVVSTLRALGVFRTLRSLHFFGEVKKVGGVIGAESITIAPGGRYALLSADDRRAAMARKPVAGAIWSYDLQSGALVNLTPDADDTFHPHGIGIWPTAAGGRLFVINHVDEGRVPIGQGRHAIEVYDWQPGRLDHIRTIDDSHLISPNAVIPDSLDTFYVSNDHGPPGLLRQLEDWLRLRRANVVRFDGSRFEVVASRISFANGVNLSADGTQLYVASTLRFSLLIYDRDPRTGALTYRRSLALGTAPDNIERDADGILWIGAHPRLVEFLASVGDAAKLSPSQVLKVTMAAHGRDRVEEVFLDPGSQLSGSAGAAAVGNRFLVATVFDDHFLDCTMK